MTAAAHTPTRIRFLACYKEGHELAGAHVERGRFCEICRLRYEYYQALKREAREFFLQSCEVEKRGHRSVVWFPKACHRCVRKTL